MTKVKNFHINPSKIWITLQRFLKILLKIILYFPRLYLSLGSRSQLLEKKIQIIAIAKRIPLKQAQHLYYEEQKQFETVFEDYYPLSQVSETEVMNLLFRLSEINSLTSKQSNYFCSNALLRKNRRYRRGERVSPRVLQRLKGKETRKKL